MSAAPDSPDFPHAGPLPTSAWPWPPGWRALVLGASGAIGAAFVEALRREPGCEHVEAVSRASHPGFDLEDADSLAGVAAACAAQGPYRLVVDATGALVIAGAGPEKHLGALEATRLARSFAVNAIGPALLLRHLAPLLAPGPAVYAKLSARVGSIADNRKGGWYGYRASKAALNQLLQTAAIELQRRQPQWRVVALQPGTVDSALSRPFSASAPQVLRPQESVAGLLAALRGLPARQGAAFVDWQGREIPW